MKEAEKTVSEPASEPAPEPTPEPIAEPEPEVAEVVKKDSVQEAVDKVQASKEGHIGTLDGGDQEGAGETASWNSRQAYTNGEQSSFLKRLPRSRH